MSIDSIQSRLNFYAPKTKQDELNGLKEIYQEIALAALSRIEFFKIAAFQGGTCLRIAHGLKRFSDDLDFILLKPQQTFKWSEYLKALQEELLAFDVQLKVIDRAKVEGRVQPLFLKNGSFGKLLRLSHSRNVSDSQVIQIKLEIDTQPPAGSQYETHFLEYPYPFSYVTQDLPSLFASKCHALLRREYLKGRDWYDFIWYVSNQTQINWLHLQCALVQTEPYKSETFTLTKEWFIDKMGKKIDSIDWKMARNDVSSFIGQEEQKSLNVWDKPFFDHLLNKLSQYVTFECHSEGD